MTITAQANRYAFSGNGVTTAFAYQSKFLANADLVVVLVSSAGVETVKTLTTHYTVTGAGDANGGTVTMLTAPATGETLVIYGDPAITQTVDLTEGDDLAVETQVETPLDRVTLIARRLDERLDRALTIPVGDTTGTDVEVPGETERANTYLVFDANGNVSTSAGTGSDTGLRTDLVTTTTDATGAGLVQFKQPETGATARTVLAKLRETISVKDFGAACDDSTDDTTAIQAAIDAMGSTSALRAGMDILIPGPCKITSTLTIRKKGIRLVGNGWGHRDDTGTRRSYLRWDGAAGTPIVKFSDNYNGGGVARLKLMGKVGAAPSAAIELNETNDSVPNQQIHLEDVYIGGFSGETGVGTQFTRGIEWTGTRVNNSEHLFQNVYITGCSGAAIYQDSVQHLNLRLDHVTFYFNGVGLHATGGVTGSNLIFLGNTIDIEQPFQDGGSQATNAQIIIHGYYSELAGRMADLDGVGRLAIYGGLFSISSSLNADGKIIVQEGNISYALRLQDFRFTQASSPSGSPHLALRSAAAGAAQRQIILDGIAGWSLLTGGTQGLDVATRGPTDRTYIFFRENAQSASSTPARTAQNFLHGSGVNWDPAHFDVKHDTALKLFDDFLGDVLADQWNGRVGTDPQCVTPTILAGGFGGVVRLVTGDDAAGDMATNGVQMESALNWNPVTGGLSCEIRLRMSAITNVAVFVGFTDQVSALEMPIYSAGAADTITTDATDAVGFLFDTAMATDNWWLVGVANNVDATAQNSGTAPSAGSHQYLRVELTSAGAATFYINGALVGTAMTGAITANISLTPVIAAFSRGAASRNIEADFVSVQGNR